MLYFGGLLVAPGQGPPPPATPGPGPTPPAHPGPSLSRFSAVGLSGCSEVAFRLAFRCNGFCAYNTESVTGHLGRSERDFGVKLGPHPWALALWGGRMGWTKALEGSRWGEALALALFLALGLGPLIFCAPGPLIGPRTLGPETN